MDYECDVGYLRTDQNTCVPDPTFKKSADGLDEDQQAMCDSFGYYTISQGYRKIPGNRCVGGLDMNPTVKYCSTFRGLFNFRTILILAIVGVILYFGWPILEAILIILPIPDPKEVTKKLKNMLSGSGASKRPNMKEYTGNFAQAPESILGESDDDDDDVGKKKRNELSYDSGEDNELIALDSSNRDRTNTAADNVPRLNRPQ